MDAMVELAIDGFPFDPKDPDIAFHRDLSAWLEVENGPKVPVALRIAPIPEQRWDWLRASLVRFQWARDHASLLAGRPFEPKLADLISFLINRISLADAKSAHLREKELILLASQAAALELCRVSSMFRSDMGRLLLNLAKHCTPAATQAIHAMLRELPPKRAAANRLAELAWCLFLNSDDPDDGHCWSAAVRSELKALTPSREKPWIGLLKLAPTSQELDARWDEKVKRALNRIGRDEWESRVAAWIGRLHGPEPPVLDRAGDSCGQRRPGCTRRSQRDSRAR